MEDSPMTEAHPKHHTGIVLVFFFLSGFIALVYQVAWQKVLTQVIGVDAYSVALIVSIFMLGLGFGGWIGGMITKFKNIPILTMYMIAEIGLGIYGIVSVPLLRHANTALLTATDGYAIQFLFNFILLLVPTLLMGTTLPLVSHMYKNVYSIGTLIGTVYSANVLGAALGAFVAGMFFIGLFGITVTVMVMGVGNILLAVSIGWYIRTFHRLQIVTPDYDGYTSIQVHYGKTIALSLLCGFIALSYEIVLFRIFTAYFGATTYVFAILITAYLGMMSVGTYIVGRLADTHNRTSLFHILSSLTLLSTLFVLYGHTFMNWLGINSEILLLWHLQTWVSYAQIPVILFVSLILMLPIAFISGFFPLIVAGATKTSQHIGSSIGTIYCIQTIGNFFGALAAGLMLLPQLGTSRTLILLAFLILLVPFINSTSIQKKELRFVGIVFMIGLVSIALYPREFYATVFRTYRDTTVFKKAQPPIAIHEGMSGVTLAYPSPDNDHIETYLGRMFSNSIYTPSSKSQSNCFPWDFISRMEQFQPRRALYIGLGTGSGPLCIKKYFPTISIDIVDLNSELITLMRERGSADTHDILNDSNLFISDGRRFVQTTSERYDVIQVGTFGAWCSGCGNLFTQEFFASLAERVNAGGIITYNAYPSAVQAGVRVFEHMSIFSRGRGVSDVVARIEKDIQLKKEQSSDNEARTPETEDILRNGCIIEREQFKERVSSVERQTDDKPITELYLTNNQFMYPLNPFASIKPPKDMRDFECIKGSDRSFYSLVFD